MTSLSIQPPRGHNTHSSPYVTLIKPSSSLSHSSILVTCIISGTSFLNHSEFLIQLIIPLLATFIWTCQFNLLHTAITFDHFITLSSKPTFSEILSSTLVCSCLPDWSHGFRPITRLICSLVLCFSSILSVLVIPKCGKLSWPALWSTFRRTIK